MKIRKFYENRQKEGQGAEVIRPFPTRMLHWPATDPFLLLDDFRVSPQAGFPEHPHRGFEIITYILRGGFWHRDSLGHDLKVPAGEAMHFVTGRGVVHSEFPLGETRGIQLWINLPRALKQTTPSVELFTAERFTLQVLPKGRKRILAGDGAAIPLHTPARYEEVFLEPGGRVAINIPGNWRGLIYVVEGEIFVEGEPARTGEGFVLEENVSANADAGEATGARLIVLQGEQQHDPVRFYGPYVD